jgi:hypothetical protein
MYYYVKKNLKLMKILKIEKLKLGHKSFWNFTKIVKNK